MIRLGKQNKSRQQLIPENYQIYELTIQEKTKFIVSCGLGLAVVSFLFYQSILLAILSTLVSWLLLPKFRSYLSEKRKRVMKDQFRDVLYSVSASIAAGRQMPDALQEAALNLRLIYGTDALIVRELELLSMRINGYREPEEELLKDFASRTDIEDITDFVDIYLTCRKTGGDLIKVLEKASGIITDKITIEKEIHAITAQKRFETKILTAIPLLLILVLQLLSPDYISVLYHGITGRLLMTMALVGIGAAYYISTKITQSEV